MTLDELARDWMVAKEAERVAVERRRALEDEMRLLTGIRDDAEGSETLQAAGYKVRVTCRIDRKVDADLVQELAAEHGLSDHLSRLFRWKPELNMSAWRSADAAITGPLAAAITAKPGRPSFSIEPIANQE